MTYRRWTQEALDRMDRETSRPLFDEVKGITERDAMVFQKMQDDTWDKLFADVPWYTPLRWYLFLLARSWVQARPRLRQWIITRTESTKGYKTRRRLFEAL